MPTIEIRPATAADTSLVLEMIKGLAEYERLLDEVEATEDRVRQTLFGPDPSAETILACDGGTCAGFAVFFRTYSTFLAQPGLYLEDLFVRPEYRGRGIGLALLRHLAAIAHQRGYGRIEWGVLDWNQPAINFYESLGARPMTGWSKYRLSGEALTALGSAEG
ncbi:MAG: GNAT family N-acetyltransferase [Bryobacterales bacterium]|nr:GNAT family N-acetyltransferase [Bryobacterales bacterium]